jgi:hypothetical protein
MSILKTLPRGGSTNDTAPFWQPPGVGWETVPLVPYESFTEYRALLQLVLGEYSMMVRRGLEIGNMQLWSVARYGLSRGVKRHWQRHGKDIFLKLTKGIGSEWCESVNSFLVTSLDTAARVFVFCRVPFPVTGFGNFSESVDDVFDILCRELCLFLHNWDINPNGRYSFYVANFKYYRSLSESLNAHGNGESEPSDDSSDDHYMPVGKFQDIMAAFAMGGHARLGAGDGCVIGILSDELLRCIFAHGIF